MKDKMIAFVMKNMRVTVATAGIVKKGNKVLLAKRSKALPEGGKWCLPGGHVKKWETSEKTIKREFKEETGFDIKRTKLLFVHEEFVRRIGVHAVVFVFELGISGKMKKNFEVSEIGWFTKKEIEKMNLAFTHKEILKKYWKEKKK